ncbi:adenylate/guanylate cyclase domain-containing protein [Hoeflea sp. WL0058]|uniref:Adenylate/guanylate cyclase domain-containing protein n=1 Tax=Flavimaribacter sediminis TaxID=2865987 RepID=A0AAE2ZMG2_9HYPH|nr:adenylate/guanylate cyclase domain-containing protein [Flavimaribacter sediminis]MBW8639318.1 adenylate/guanylate cyclase domain-containing protein [Flavimaribacter sediminis]
MTLSNFRFSRLNAVYAGLFSVVLLGLLAMFGTERLSSLVFDEYQRLKPREYAQAPVLVVDIDEASLEALGQWPWPRSQLAEIVNVLASNGAAAISFDVAFPEDDRSSPSRSLETLRELGAEISFPDGAPELDNDVLFAEALQQAPAVIGFALDRQFVSKLPEPKAGWAYGGPDPKAILQKYYGSMDVLPLIEQAAQGLGFFSFIHAFDGVVRKVPIIAVSEEHTYPSLALETLRVAQQASNFIVMSTGASGEADTGLPAVVSVRVGGFTAETNADGSLWIYYSGRAGDNTLPVKSLLDGSLGSQQLQERIAGHIVLIGTSAISLRDLVVTPLSQVYPGVNVHAEIIDQIMSGTFLHRPDYMAGLEYALALIAIIFMVVAVRPGRFTISAILAMLMLAGAIGLSWYMFAERHLLLDPIPLLFAILVSYFSITLLQYLGSEQEKRFIRNAFGRYLAPSLVERLTENPSALNLGGETRELTLLFCDIRGFTTISEELSPQELTQLLNNFLTPMTDELLKSQATIDKYMGDAILAFWNAPLTVENHRTAALGATVHMANRLDALNAEKGYGIRMGVGLHTGECLVGNLGSTQRFSYSVIGDAANVASRIEGITKYYGLTLLFEQSLLEGGTTIPEGYRALEVDRVRVVGRDSPLVLHTLIEKSALNNEAAFYETHDAFLAAYRGGRFEEAQEIISRLTGMAPDRIRPMYETFANRLSGFVASPPPGWDGVFDFTEK